MDINGVSKYPVYNKRKGGTHMAEMKNICGKIPLELHTKVRQEIEQREISTQQFIQQVIEEHFTEKGGQVSMAVRTVAVQVSEELFARFKAAVAKKGCRQKDFLIALIERAIEEIEVEFGEENASAALAEETRAEAPPAEPEPENREMESEGTEASEAGETAETEAEEPKEPAEPETEGAEAAPEEEAEVPEESADAEEPDETEAREPKETDGIEDGKPEESENEEASEPETADAGEAEQEPDDTVTEE